MPLFIPVLFFAPPPVLSSNAASSVENLSIVAQAAPPPATPTPASPTPAPSAPVSVEVVRLQEVRPLPGRLDTIPTFNSNSPELVLREGILLSTFSPIGKVNPEAHLDYVFDGRFDLFAHHATKSNPPYEADLRTLYLGVILQNKSTKPVTVDVLQGASYLSQPDAPFVALSPFLDNPQGKVYSGPGGRAMDDVLRGLHQAGLPKQVTIAPGDTQILLNLPISIKGLTPPINGRSTFLRLRSSGPVYAASLALYAKLEPKPEPKSDPLKPNSLKPDPLKPDPKKQLPPKVDSPLTPIDPANAAEPNGQPTVKPKEFIERPPTLEEWKATLLNGNLSGPRDKIPTPLDAKGSVIYSRVAGVSIGSRWSASLTDPGSINLALPAPGGAVSYGISTLHLGRLGTGQNQSAKMAVRYPDTAYEAHGNYGIEYNLSLPLINRSDRPQTVTVALETAIKEDGLSKQGLRFYEPLPKPVFFRGTVRVRSANDQRRAETRYVHLVHRRGQAGTPLVTLTLKPREQRLVQFDLLYPPDATPPQVLTVQTIDPNAAPVPSPLKP
jgi:hypothetical protein